jgi:glycosyltransferase involved in cell wall biosynthesis
MGANAYLFVINSLMAGGAERSLLDLLPQLTGIQPLVATLRTADVGFEDEARRRGVQLIKIGGSNRFAQILRLRRLIRDLRPAVVHTSLFDADLAGRIAAIGLGVPVVTSLVNTAYDSARTRDPGVKRWKLAFYRWIDGLTARHLTSHFHAVSHAVKDSAISDLRLRPELITVVERGRDGTRFSIPSVSERETARAQERIPPEAFVFVTVGRHEYQKGQVHLLRAFARVAAAHRETRLLIVGREGHTTPELLTIVRELGLEERVTLTGHREDVPQLLRVADVFVFPSMYEGLGGALLEAMATGLPIIASDIAPLREATDGGQAGLLVRSGDPGAIAEGMERLYADETLRQHLGKAAREIFLARFQSDSANRRMGELLARVAKAGR